MKPVYYDIYNELRFAYRQKVDASSYELRRLVGDNKDLNLDWLERAIYQAEADCGKRLRPDAKFFLLTNFHLMVVLPLEHRLSEADSGTGREATLADVKRIVAQAAKSTDESEISGGAILKAASNLWDVLKTNAQKIWT